MRSITKIIWRILRLPLSVLLLCGLYLGGLQLVGNFHTVVPGELYRSAQVTPASINEYAEKYHIRSILNLRGDNTGSPWYDAEVMTANAAGITHLNFRMSARKDLTPERAQELLTLMRDAPKPLLVHCVSGADRTGLASALYLVALKHAPEEEAKQELWPIYGHLSLPFIREYAMDRSFEALKTLSVGTAK